MLAVVSPGAYAAALVIGVASGIALCVAARRRPGPWRVLPARAIGVVLVADALSWTIGTALAPHWSARSDLPLSLCDAALFVAGLAAFWPRPLLVEVTYFWGLAGAAQALITPDLSTPFPRLAFFEYVGGHLGIVVLACYLTVGMGLTPRRGAVWRCFAISAAYTAVVGAVDAASGADYMFLRRRPGNWTLLSALGPWPWYIVGAAGVALALFGLLELPFWLSRRRYEVAARREANESGASDPRVGHRVAASPVRASPNGASLAQGTAPELPDHRRQ